MTTVETDKLFTVDLDEAGREDIMTNVRVKSLSGCITKYSNLLRFQRGLE